MHPRFTPCSPRLHRAWFQRFKLKYGELSSNVAFNFNLRRYVLGGVAVIVRSFARIHETNLKVGTVPV